MTPLQLVLEQWEDICYCGHIDQDHEIVDDILMCYRCTCTFWEPIGEEYEDGEI